MALLLVANFEFAMALNDKIYTAYDHSMEAVCTAKSQLIKDQSECSDLLYNIDNNYVITSCRVTCIFMESKGRGDARPDQK